MNRRQLEVINDTLTVRDRAILHDVERFRLLTTKQVQALHFDDGKTTLAAARANTRALTRLREQGLISALDRRIGGARRGSASFIWQLGATGERLLRQGRAQRQRRRYLEPSGLFTAHTLAVAELAVAIITTSRAGHFSIEQLQTEPANWRTFLGPGGETIWLKPDLYVVTSTQDYEDHYFVEVDLSTEHMPKILAKSRTYQDYSATGLYQAEHGLYPAVAWISEQQARRTALAAAIRNTRQLPPELFTIHNAESFVAAFDGNSPPSKPGGGVEHRDS